MHLYRTSRPWAVGLLALLAASGAVLVTGGATFALGGRGGPEAGIEQKFRAPGGESSPISPVLPTAPGPARSTWQIQVGAFSSAQASTAHLRALAGRVPRLLDHQAELEASGPVVRARVAGIADEAAARALCAAVIAQRSDCFVVEPRP